MSDFYLDTNWGPTLLPLVARGSSIICEICRLSDYIPNEYKINFKNEYSEIMCDFSYFSTTDAFEHKIDSKHYLQDLDEKFKDNHIQLLERFYRLFESVYKFVTDLNHFVVSLEDGHFVQHDLVSVMQNEDGKQLMCEALYLYGTMLLLLDQKIEGVIREKLLVSFYRYSSKQSNLDSNTEDVCQLLRSTGFTINLPSNKRPPEYPESFFKRIPIDARFISMVLDKLRSDDFYHQTLAYPMPEHRSVARATQANMLYVCLFFWPHCLHAEPALMREIVDKHFSDNWVLGGYLGNSVNLVDGWAPYKAASAALSNTIDLAHVKSLASRHCRQLTQKLLPGLERILGGAGTLEREYVLDKVARLMDRVRDCNVTLRWLMLHAGDVWPPGARANKRCLQLRDAVLSCPDFRGGHEAVFRLLVLTAQFELKLGDCLRDILDSRETSWSSLQQESVGRVKELAEVFSGSKALARMGRNEKLEGWFGRLAEQIEALDPGSNSSSSSAAGRTLDQLVQALREVLEFHQLDSNVVVRQFIGDTCASLQQMMRLLNLQERLLLDLSICGDMGYALNLVDSYTGYMQSGLTKDPFLAIQLRAVFLKLASSLDSPLIRLNQCSSRDLLSVTQYYSSELVQYVRKVLQIIPESMFGKMASIIALQTDGEIRELPTRLDKDKVKEHVQFEQRAQLARLTHDISVFTQGVLMMKSTLVGIIELDPHKLLEDGIRKELVIHVSKAFDSKLVFSSKSKYSELDSKLEELANTMDGYRRSFEYVQDYVNIYGLQMWREEVSRVINFNVERECNIFMRTKVPEYNSSYQSKTIPIPSYPRVDDSLTFVGRIVTQILKITDPRTSIYVPHVQAWFDIKTKAEVANIRLFSKLESAFNSFGLSSLDRLFGLLIVKELQNYLKHFQRTIRDTRVLETLASFLKMINPISKTINVKMYNDTTNRLNKSIPAAVDIILKIGQLQLLREHVAGRLGLSCKFEARFLHSALVALNQSLLLELERHRLFPASCPYPGVSDAATADEEEQPEAVTGEPDIVSLTTKLLHSAGLHHPNSQVYITTQRFTFGSLYPSLLLVSVVGRLQYSRQADVLVSTATPAVVDGHVFARGLATLMRQLHPVVAKEMLALAAQFMRSSAQLAQSKNGTVIYPGELINCLLMLDDFCLLSGKPTSVLDAFLPPRLTEDIRSQARAAE